MEWSGRPATSKNCESVAQVCTLATPDQCVITGQIANETGNSYESTQDCFERSVNVAHMCEVCAWFSDEQLQQNQEGFTELSE
jgi:hypothetical protein